MEWEDLGVGELVQPAQESTASKVAANIVRPLSKVASGVLGLPGAAASIIRSAVPSTAPSSGPQFQLGKLGEALGSPSAQESLTKFKQQEFPTAQDVQGSISKGLSTIVGQELPERFTKGQNPIERFADRAIEGAFYSAALGPGVLATLPATLGSAFGATAAEELGAGPLGELAGGIGGGILGQAGASRAAQAIGKGAATFSPRQKIMEELNKDKGEAQKIAETLKYKDPKVSELVDEIKKTKEEVVRGIVPGKNLILDRLDGLLDAVQAGSANIGKIWKQNEWLNKTLFERKIPDADRAAVQQFLQPIRKSTLGIMEDVAKKNPTFGNPYSAYKKSYIALQGPRFFKDFVEELPNAAKILKHPAALTSLGLGIPSYFIHPLLPVGVGIGSWASQHAFRLGKAIWQDPRSAEILTKTATSIFNSNIPQAEKYLAQYNNLVESKSKSLKPIEWEELGSGELIR